MNTVDVHVEIRDRLANIWCALMVRLSPALGLARTARAMRWGILRFTRYRFAGGEWKRLPADTLAEVVNDLG